MRRANTLPSRMKAPKEPKDKKKDKEEKEDTAASGTAALKDLTGDPFLGHLGHLTSQQEVVLTDFKTLLAGEGLYKAAEGETQASHDDPTLLRFLRARRFNIQDAQKQFKDTEEWRQANELTELYNTIEVDDYDETRNLYPTWTGRRDRRGYPVYVFEVAKLPGQMAAYNKSLEKANPPKKGDSKTPTRLLRLFTLYDNMTEFVLPLCTALKDKPSDIPISQSNNIVDIRGVTLMQFWNLKGHMQDASTLATAHYPETLDRVFIIGAPAFFPTVWGWIKRWFDPVTTSKIFILHSSEVKPVLSSFIDPVNIPKKYGGELDYEFGQMPALDDAMKESVTWTNPNAPGFPKGPARWVRRPDGDWDMVAVGSVGGKERKEHIAVFKPGPAAGPPMAAVGAVPTAKVNGTTAVPAAEVVPVVVPVAEVTEKVNGTTAPPVEQLAQVTLAEPQMNGTSA